MSGKKVFGVVVFAFVLSLFMCLHVDLNTATRLPPEIRSVSISSDGNYIATGGGYTDYYRTTKYDVVRSEPSGVFLFSRTDNTPLWSASIGETYSVSISSDGSYIAAGAAKAVYLFSRTSSTPLWNYPTGDWVKSVAISSTGSYIAAGTSGAVYLFSKENNTPLWSASIGETYSVSISSDGSYIAAGTLGSIYLFSKDNSTPLWTYSAPITDVAISSTGDYIAAGGSGGVYLFSKEDNTPLWSASIGETYSVSISSDGSYIAAGTLGSIYLFSKEDNTHLWQNSPHQLNPDYFSVVISSDGNYIAADSALDPSAILFQRQDQAVLWDANVEGSTTLPWCINSIGTSSDGAYVAKAGGEYLYLFSRENSAPIWVYSFSIHEPEAFPYHLLIALLAVASVGILCAIIVIKRRGR